MDLQTIVNQTTIGIELPEAMSKDDWRDFGRRIHQAEGSLNWIVGDWLVKAQEDWFGSEKGVYHEAQMITGWTYEKLRHCKMTST